MWRWNRFPLTHFRASSHVYHPCRTATAENKMRVQCISCCSQKSKNVTCPRSCTNHFSGETVKKIAVSVMSRTKIRETFIVYKKVKCLWQYFCQLYRRENVVGPNILSSRMFLVESWTVDCAGWNTLSVCD